MSQFLLVAILWPPIGTGVFFVLCYLWGNIVQGGRMSAKTLKWLQKSLLPMLAVQYLIAIIVGILQHKF